MQHLEVKSAVRYIYIYILYNIYIYSLYIYVVRRQRVKGKGVTFSNGLYRSKPCKKQAKLLVA
jgi:hypothetical protein